MANLFKRKGKVKYAAKGEKSLLLIDVATTNTKKLKKLIAEFCRKEVATIRPWFGPFQVHIRTSLRDDRRGFHDVDNIAKACLDALNGIFWRDDRQVVRLISEKFISDVNRIAIIVTPLEGPLSGLELDETLLEYNDV
ncbi:MAG: RusA family crossover junction endodeoxyribonuclease [bacterium]